MNGKKVKWIKHLYFKNKTTQGNQHIVCQSVTHKKWAIKEITELTAHKKGAPVAR